MLHKQPRTLNSKVKVQKGWMRINRRLVRVQVKVVIPAEGLDEEEEHNGHDDEEEEEDEEDWFDVTELDNPTDDECRDGGGFRRV